MPLPLYYSISIAPGFLISNIHNRKIDNIEFFLECLEMDIVTDNLYVGDKIKNIFVPITDIKRYDCCKYLPEWEKFGIPNFIGNNDVYDENKMDLYAERLQKFYQDNNVQFEILFLGMPIDDLPVHAYCIKIYEKNEKEKMIEIFFEELQKKLQKFDEDLKLINSIKLKENEIIILREILEKATCGDIVMKHYM